VGDLKSNNQTAELATAQQATLWWCSGWQHQHSSTSGDSNEWQNISKENNNRGRRSKWYKQASHL